VEYGLTVAVARPGGRRREGEDQILLPGDGIGPEEIVAEAVRVLEAVARRGGRELRFEERLRGRLLHRPSPAWR